MRPFPLSSFVLVGLLGAALVACDGDSDALIDDGRSPGASATTTRDGDETDAAAPDQATDADVTPREDGGGPPDAAPSPSPVLAPAVAKLAGEVATRSPGTELGLAVYDFATKEYAGANDDVMHISASSAKAMWVAAALKKTSIAQVQPYARPIFEQSSNADSSSVIELAGPNYINDFYAAAGMTRSGYTQWMGGRVASNSPRALGSDNYFTARDVVAFLRGVQGGSLLDAARNDALRTWMTWSPRTGYGGWMGTLLPSAVKATMMHKAGWLPPDCCDARSVNEIGLIEAGAGHWLAVAILARKASDYAREQRFVEHASCVLYAAAAQATPDCM